MKKKIFIHIFILAFLGIIQSSSYAFDLYGCWKSEQKPPLNILKFDKDTYYYGKHSLPAKFSTDGNKYIVIFNVDSEMHIIPEGDNSIKVTFPTQVLPQNIIYTRVTEEERANLIKMR